jgi:hypothetical protein
MACGFPQPCERFLVAGGRVNFDGSGREDILTGRTNPQFLALSQNRVFWTEYVSGLWSADRSGSDIQHLVQLTGLAIAGLALDETAGKVYFASAASGGNLYRANLDGSGFETLWHVSLASGTYGLAIDSQQGLIYTTEYSPTGSVRVYNLATGASTSLYLDRPHPLGLSPICRSSSWCGIMFL